MSVRTDFSFRTLVAGVFLFLIFLSYGVFSLYTLNLLKVNGPLYKRLVLNHELISDILPPSEYILESYQVALQMLNETDQKLLANDIQKVRSLQSEYESRHDFWSKNIEERGLRSAMLKDSYKPAMEFYRVLDEQFIPSIQKGDKPAAAMLAAGILRDHYNVHRMAIDRVVKMALDRIGAEEKVSASIVKQRSLVLTIIGLIGIILLGLILVLRKRMEDVLHASEGKYRGLVELTGTGFLILDGQGRVVDANEEYVRLSGHSQLREILGRSVVEWTAEEAKQRNAEAVAECARNGFIRNFVTEYTNKSGRKTFVEINAGVEDQGGVPRIVSLCRDVTERKLADGKAHGQAKALRVFHQQLVASAQSVKAVNQQLREREKLLLANEEELKAAQSSLEKKIEELTATNKRMNDREFRIIEMKKEVNRLCRELGRPEPYGVN